MYTIMVIILDGNSQIFDLFKAFKTPRVVTNSIFLEKIPIFLHTFETCSELPSNKENTK